jgi:hypothetical protein
MECSIQRTLGVTQRCHEGACPFWESAAGEIQEGCFVEHRLGLELLSRRDMAGWLIGLRSALERVRVEEGGLP